MYEPAKANANNNPKIVTLDALLVDSMLSV